MTSPALAKSLRSGSSSSSSVRTGNQLMRSSAMGRNVPVRPQTDSTEGDAMNRTDVEFNAEGTTLRGWLYRPDGDGVAPGVVMAHGFSATKEMYLDAFAEVFAGAGLAALVFDNRNFGASDGEPRYEIDPWAQVRDYRHAISYLQTLPGIDRARIGVWGSSYSGGHALVLGAIDKRIKAVVSPGPPFNGFKNVQRLVRSDFLPLVR